MCIKTDCSIFYRHAFSRYGTLIEQRIHISENVVLGKRLNIFTVNYKCAKEIIVMVQKGITNKQVGFSKGRRSVTRPTLLVWERFAHAFKTRILILSSTPKYSEPLFACAFVPKRNPCPGKMFLSLQYKDCYFIPSFLYIGNGTLRQSCTVIVEIFVKPLLSLTL